MKLLLILLMSLVFLGLGADSTLASAGDAYGIQVPQVEGAVLTATHESDGAKMTVSYDDEEKSTTNENLINTIVAALGGWLVEWIRHRFRRKLVEKAISDTINDGQRHELMTKVEKLPPKAQTYLKKVIK